MSNISASVKRIVLPPPPWELTNGVSAPPMEALGGEFAIQTARDVTYLTAVNGGGKTTDVMHTDAVLPRAWETFRLWVDSATRQWYAFQTVDGHFVTANPPGGFTAANALRTTAGAIFGSEMFKLPGPEWIYNAIQMPTGFYLTAVDGGGHHDDDAIHTDAVEARQWEYFSFVRKGDLGAGSMYVIQAARNIAQDSGSTPWLTAWQGGNVHGPYGAVGTGSFAAYELNWTLLKQDDGSYALQTGSGKVLTAIGGGALPAESGFRTDTDVNQIGDWERFTVVDNGDFTAYIKTSAGTYFAVQTNPQGINPTYGGIMLVANPNDAIRWQFLLLPSPTGN
jgi:hypothetical protein